MEGKKMRPLKGGQYYPVNYDKFAIALHHTAGGSIIEAFNWWNQTKEVVGTPYGIERDGTLYECFPVRQWAYQFGLSNVTPAQKSTFEKGVVGIELASYGWVLKEGNEFFSYPAWPQKTRRVKIKSEDVVELKESWRGHKFWHRYTEKQIETTVKLCRYLVDEFKIQVQENLETFFEYDLSVVKEKKSGIWSHTTVRKDKYDVYPDPDLIKALMKEFKKEIKETTFKLTKPMMKDSRLEPIQTKLKGLGMYKDKIDGIFGNNSKKAIETFQKSKNLKVTGEITFNDEIWKLLS